MTKKIKIIGFKCGKNSQNRENCFNFPTLHSDAPYFVLLSNNFVNLIFTFTIFITTLFGPLSYLCIRNKFPREKKTLFL